MSAIERTVGVDLGGTNVRAALVDLTRGKLLAEAKRPVGNSDGARDPATVVEEVVNLVRAVDPKREAGGVGIGFAGMLRGWTGVVVNAPNFGWREVELRRMLRAQLGDSVELYNDLNAIAYGEATFGGARGSKDVLCVYVGTGIGAGFVTDGALYVGASHLAGEIGHVKVAFGADARLCGCGQRGCIEAYASGKNLALRAHEELSRPEASSRAVAIAGSLDKVHAGHLDEAAASGDPYASSLWDEVATLLGSVLANAVTLVNPDKLVMGGGVWQGAPDLRRRTLAAFERLVNAPSRDGLSIVDTTLGDDAGVLGAASLIARGAFSPRA